MPQREYTASEAARRLGISLDTLRRWDRQGRIKTTRDASNRRLVAAKEVERLLGRPVPHELSARNRLTGVVSNVRIEGLLAQIEMDAAIYSAPAVIGDALYLATARRLYLIAASVDSKTR